MLLDIERLRVVWWVLLGVLFMGFAVMDGFDLGAAVLLPLVTKDDMERRIVLNTIGPVWEGNQVWIILGAGAIFAAWPFVYAVAFSSFYFVMLLLLLTMGISRPVSFKYRSKLPNLFWRRFWDWVVFAGGLCPALIFGILVGNVLTGVPFYFDDDLRVTYTGATLSLFHPFAWLCAFTSLAMLVMHGGLYLAIKTNAPIRERALFWSQAASLLVIVLFALGGWWVAKGLLAYQVLSGVDPLGYSNPLHKEVVSTIGAWLLNYQQYPWTKLVPAFGFLGAMLAFLTARFGMGRFAFVMSSLSVMGIIGTVGVSMFPFILPSSTNLASGLLVWDASSSYLTLLMMLFAVAIFLPVILLYTGWVYRVMRGKVTRQMVEQDESHTTY